MQLLLSLLVPAPASQLSVSCAGSLDLQAAWLADSRRSGVSARVWRRMAAAMAGWLAAAAVNHDAWAACGRYEYVMSPCPCHREWRPLPPAPLSPSPPADRVPAPSSRAWLTWWSSDWYVHGGVAFVCVARCTPEHRVSERLCSASAELVRID